ncbi:MAG: deoxynucleoside kinase [Planctomycetota bacterium]|nr:deoxynucleoside kinase [Planctomycetota bacterium]
MSAKLISIIGPPAVGKTTLAERLARELPAELIREDYAGNPYLAESYVGRAEARLPSQLYFLNARVAQLSVTRWPAEGVFVSDYGFCQDCIYARLRLSEADFRLYRRVARRLEGLIHRPELVIRLDASVETLLRRISARGRDYERVMDREFITTMREAYNNIDGCTGGISIDCDKVDLRQDGAGAKLLSQIREKL